MRNNRIDRRRFLKAASVAGVVGLAGCSGGDGGDGGGSGGGSGSSGDSGGSSGGSGGQQDTTTGGSNDLDFEWTPDRNVSVIVPWGAGGGTDTMTRAVMNPAEDILRENDITGFSINVQNITGANGLNATSYVKEQPADGHTIFANTSVIEENIVRETASFTLDDWMGIGRVQHDTSWLYSSGKDGVGHDSIDSLIEKANNEGIQIGVVGGALSSVFVLQFIDAAGIIDGTQIVSYSDAGRQRNDAIAGETDAAFGEIQEMKEQYESGDVQLLLVGTEEPLDDFSDVTAAGEKGWDATFGVSRGFVAQQGTPQEAVDFWSKLVENAMQTDPYKQVEQETLLYLREGWLPPEEWKQKLQENIDLFKDSQEVFEQVKTQEQ